MNSTKLKNITFLQIMKFFKWSRWYHICFFDKPFFRTQSFRAFQTEAFFRMKLIYGFILMIQINFFKLSGAHGVIYMTVGYQDF